jgi:hypothetical protein
MRPLFDQNNSPTVSPVDPGSDPDMGHLCRKYLKKTQEGILSQNLIDVSASSSKNNQKSSFYMGERTLKPLFVLVSAPNISTADYIDQEQVNGLAEQLKSYYERVSRGQISVVIDQDQDQQADLIGLELESIASCGVQYFADEVLPLIEGDKRNQYTHFIFITANASLNSHCPYRGVAELNGKVAHLGQFSQHALIHEYGHLLGLGHAAKLNNSPFNIPSTKIESLYGGHDDIMAFIDDYIPHMNPVHLEKLGLVSIETGEIQLIENSGTYTLYPLADEGADDQVRIFQIGGLLSRHKMRLAFRAPVGEDDDLPPDWSNKLVLYDARDITRSYVLGGTTSSIVRTIVDGPNMETSDHIYGLRMMITGLNNDGSINVKIDFPSFTYSDPNCTLASPELGVHYARDISDQSLLLGYTIKNLNSYACGATEFKVSLVESNLSELSAEANINQINALVSPSNSSGMGNSLTVISRPEIHDESYQTLSGKMKFEYDGKTELVPFEFSIHHHCEQ